MYGVVLWSDPGAQKAVIWCEDHGDLAFYAGRSGVPLGDRPLDPGDLVEFEVSCADDLRYAHNPQVVSERMYPDLASKLQGAVAPRPKPNKKAESARILPFRPQPAPQRSPGYAGALSLSV